MSPTKTCFLVMAEGSIRIAGWSRHFAGKARGLQALCVRALELDDEIVIARGCSLTVAHDALRSRAKFAPQIPIGREARDRGRKLRGVLHEPSGVRRKQILDGFLEAEIVRTEQHRDGNDRGLH